MREGEEGKTETETERERESEMGETSRANSNANELLHWQIIRGSHLASRFFSKSSREMGTKRRNPRVIAEIIESRLEIYRVPMLRESLFSPPFEYHKGMGGRIRCDGPIRLDTPLIWTCPSRFLTFENLAYIDAKRGTRYAITMMQE